MHLVLVQEVRRRHKVPSGKLPWLPAKPAEEWVTYTCPLIITRKAISRVLNPELNSFLSILPGFPCSHPRHHLISEVGGCVLLVICDWLPKVITSRVPSIVAPVSCLIRGGLPRHIVFPKRRGFVPTSSLFSYDKMISKIQNQPAPKLPPPTFCQPSASLTYTGYKVIRVFSSPCFRSICRSYSSKLGTSSPQRYDSRNWLCVTVQKKVDLKRL